jgi:hypothetical protein
MTSRPSVDTRTRSSGHDDAIDPAAFWAGAWETAVTANGARAADDAARLRLKPLAVTVDGKTRTLRLVDGTLEVAPGRASEVEVTLDHDAFADLVTEHRTALGLVIGARTEGDATANDLFCRWDPVLRSVLDGRGVYRPGDVTLLDRAGSPLDLDQRFRLGERTEDAGHFLAEAGFLLLSGVLTDAELDAIDDDLLQAVDCATPDDGEAWWAGTADGVQYPCRILNFERKSDALRALFDEARYRAVGELLADGHAPGDPFGEHYADVTAEGLVKRVDSVEGLACLPWHKDCDRGGHSRYCSGLTIGICLTAVDEAHGGLDVMAGSHRANIAREQAERGLDLPAVTLRADRGDVTVHLSCALHRSTHPSSAERRVAYSGFTLPPRGGAEVAAGARDRLERERAAIGDPSRRARLGPDA